ncbi:O-acyltransferase [Caenorhabditis elegans]|uniref:O-acyltransferase n=1 Tax=Caenorhabditis elegans TaxID=6239 RepID=Q17498_CAEEL|nr:O-acyltransferase [Caenorhabditis elegans]CAA92217.1 O-acyltransferase [Caenorhabditis elegans]|eukprot:NP_510623.1 O-acyltransferase [Caenorhabditis elegans]
MGSIDLAAKGEENNNNVILKEHHEQVSVKHKKREFKEKTFVVRESLLTSEFRNGHMKIIYNCFTAAFLLFFLRAMIDDILVHKMPFHHTWLIWWNFQNFIPTMAVWTGMFLSTIGVYYAYEHWSTIPSKNTDLASNLPFVTAYVTYLAAFFYFPLKFLYESDLKCACSFIITCETTRIAMKVHSFIRENWDRAMKRKIGGTIDAWPTMEQFLYYQFCPSFIYRDSYPRTEKRDMKAAGLYFLECLAVIEFVNLTFTQWVFPWLHVQDYTSLSFSTIALSLFTGIIPGIICMTSLFYGLLHCWLNCFSEMMQFADRQFYLNWWHSSNMAEYYRNWNLVVHDWLYAYVFRDLAAYNPGRKGQRAAQMAVFFLSAVFHEYWFGVAFRCFYPVMFVLYFIFGGTFFAVSRLITNRSAWNTALWFNLLIGTGMFIAFYGQEWYARRGHCAPYSNAVVDLLFPRHWNCHPPTS